jgi:DNA-binding protein H-NS
MSTLKELLEQIAALESRVAEVRKVETADAIAKVRSIVEEYQLTEQDIFPVGKNKKDLKVKNKVAAKYRDPDTGKFWSGRGIAPKWLENQDRNNFLIAQ